MDNTPLMNLELVIGALTAGTICSKELRDQVTTITDRTIEELQTMTVAQILGLLPGRLLLRSSNIDRLLGAATSGETVEKLQLLHKILTQLRDFPADEDRPRRLAWLQSNYPYLQQGTLEKIEESTLYEIITPGYALRKSFEKCAEKWNTLVGEFAENDIQISDEQAVEAYMYLKNSRKYKPAEVLDILGGSGININPKTLTEVCKAIQGVKPLEFLQVLRREAEMDEKFLTGAVYPLLMQEILELRENGNLDHLLIFGANAWFLGAWCAKGALREIPTTYIFPDGYNAQVTLTTFANLDVEAEAVYERDFDQRDVAFSERTAVILFAAAGYPLQLQKVLSSIREKSPDQPIPLYIVAGTAEYATFEPVYSLLKSEYTNIRSIVMFPQDLPDPSYPKRKQLICASISGIPISHGPVVELIKLTKQMNGDVYYLASPRLFESAIRIDYGRFLNNQSETLRGIYAQEIWNGTTRGNDESFQIAPELAVAYRFQHHNNGEQLVCAFLGLPQGKRTKGKQMHKTEKRKMISQSEDFFQWLNRTYPYMHIGRGSDSPRIIDIVRDAFEETLRKRDQGISFKTVFYFYTDEFVVAREQLLELVDTELGQLNVRSSQETVETILLNLFENKTRRSRALYLLIEIAKVAVRKGYLSECPLRPDTMPSKNKELAEIRNALSKKSFTKAEMATALQETQKALETRPEYLGTLIRLFTGLERKEVAALRWSDYQHNDVFAFCQIKVERQWAAPPKGARGFEHVKSYRTIPVAPILNAYLSEQAVCHAGSDYIVAHSDGTGLTPPEIRAMDNQIFRCISEEGRKIYVPNEDGEPVEVDLINYSGDFLRTNADYWFGRIGLTEDELKYLLGLYPQTTFGRKYCDFAAPETQYVIYRKFCRWAPGEPSAYPAKWTRRELKPQTSTTLAPKKQTTVHTSAVLVNTSDRDLHLQITCNGGVSISISEVEDIE